MTKAELLIQETIIYLLEIRKDYTRNISMNDINENRTNTRSFQTREKHNL